MNVELSTDLDLDLRKGSCLSLALVRPDLLLVVLTLRWFFV